MPLAGALQDADEQTWSPKSALPANCPLLGFILTKLINSCNVCNDLNQKQFSIAILKRQVCLVTNWDIFLAGSRGGSSLLARICSLVAAPTHLENKAFNPYAWRKENGEKSWNVFPRNKNEKNKLGWIVGKNLSCIKLGIVNGVWLSCKVIPNHKPAKSRLVGVKLPPWLSLIEKLNLPRPIKSTNPGPTSSATWARSVSIMQVQRMCLSEQILLPFAV